MNKKIIKTPNILFSNINEFNIRLILIIGVIFIMLSGYTSYALFSDTIISNNIISLIIGKKNYEKTFSYTGNCEEYIVPYNGYYKIEAWGAEGGTPNETYSKGGKGGYTSGITKLLKGETLNICVGGKGTVTNGEANQTSTGGFNGGGDGYNHSSYTKRYAGSGGGATDIRLVGGTWNSEEGLNLRIMAAAGGGGGWWFDNDWRGTGGNGGGLIGKDGVGKSNGNSVNVAGGTQTSTNFGIGASLGYDGTSGGGGGYYGGNNNWFIAGGGSSFISGYAGVNAIASSTDRTHTNDTLHYSNKYFINAKMEAGASSGNGKAKITYISSTKPERKNTNLNNVRYIKDCTKDNSDNTGNHTVELQAIYNGVNIALGKIPTESHGYLEGNSTTQAYTNATDGKIENIDGYSGFAFSPSSDGEEFCLVVDLGETYDLDEVAVWHYWKATGRTYNDNYTYVSNDNTNWTLIIDKQEPETSEGKRVNAYEETSLMHQFSYAGSCEEYTVPYNGYYKIEAWGAEGGTANDTYSKGGKGGYTSGITKLLKGETLNICVGGKGTVTNGEADQTSTGGFNGGGDGYNHSSYTKRYAGSGGGATDIRLVGGTWNSEEGLNSRIMAAAGGGGGWWFDNDWRGTGGNGGGLIGKDGVGKNNGNSVNVAGGTQTSTNFGIGASLGYDGTSGGGGGYYGGNNNWFIAGGGSSFISGYAGVNAITSSTDRTHTNDTLHYSNKYFINAKMEAGASSGNGKAKITYISSTKPERINANLNNVRYIKECLNGSSASSYNQLGELEAIYNGVNVAKGKTIRLYNQDGTEVNEYNNTTHSFTLITDGDINTNDSYGVTYSGNQCYILDLGQTYDLDEIAVWHYWKDGRTYNDNYTYVSSDNSNWIKVIDRQEPETSEGKRANAYEGISLTINQNTGGTLTCKNNKTGISSTTTLKVVKGDSITCTSNVSSGYRLTSLKIGSTSYTSGTAFTYNFDAGVTIIPTYYKYCTQTEAYSYGSWSACSASCGGGTQTRTVYYRDKNYTSYTSCGTSTQSQSCNTGSCELSCDCAYRSSNIVSVGYYWTCSAGHSHNTAYIHYCKCWRGSTYAGTYSYDNNAYYTNGSKVVTYKWVCPTWNSYKTI